jgi:hypothetical protein
MTRNTVFAGFGGRRLLSRAELSLDRQRLTLFYLENVPAAAQISVVFDTNDLPEDVVSSIDPDGDGIPGGTLLLQFSTAGTAGLQNTAVIGRVFASAVEIGSSNRPLEGAIVTVDGAEETLRAVTDASGASGTLPLYLSSDGWGFARRPTLSSIDGIRALGTASSSSRF